MSPGGTPITGGCQCGAVRFSVESLGDASICHCRMCQKAFGNYSAPLVKVENLEWTRGECALYRSSNVSQRGFCAQCGTPLTLEDADGSVELAIATLDNPKSVRPAYHANTTDCVIPPSELGSLPGETSERQSENSAWNAKVVSHQHPDHDTEKWDVNQ